MQANKWLVLLALTLIIFEFALRMLGWGDPPISVLDNDIEYYPKPSSEYYRYGNLIKINKYGMRSDDFNIHQQTNPHISLLGDSVVYGNHFLDQSDTISAQLQQLLRTSMKEALVSSISASSWGPQNIEAFFNKKGPFSGQIAIIVQSAQDRYDVMNLSQSVVPYRTQPSLFATTDFIERIWEWLRSKSYITRSKKNKYSPVEANRITCNSLFSLLVTLKNHYDVVILYYHKTTTLMKNKDDDPNESYYKSMAEDASVIYINSKEFYGLTNELNDLFRDHIHLTRNGAKRVASYLYDYILKNNLLSGERTLSNSTLEKQVSPDDNDSCTF